MNTDGMDGELDFVRSANKKDDIELFILSRLGFPFHPELVGLYAKFGGKLAQLYAANTFSRGAMAS